MVGHCCKYGTGTAYYGEQLDQLSRLAASVVGGAVVDVVGGVVGCQVVSQCQ